jgi:AraC family transcriptional regulator
MTERQRDAGDGDFDESHHVCRGSDEDIVGMAAGSVAGSNVRRLLEAAGNKLASAPHEACMHLREAVTLIESGRAVPHGRLAQAPLTVRGGLPPRHAAMISAFVGERFGARIRTTELAALAGLSPSYFFRAFKESFGISPQAYVMKVRVDRAKEMMLASDEPLSQVALACGLSDQAHFSRVFRKTVGQSPRAWRRECVLKSGARQPCDC